MSDEEQAIEDAQLPKLELEEVERVLNMIGPLIEGARAINQTTLEGIEQLIPLDEDELRRLQLAAARHLAEPDDDQLGLALGIVKIYGLGEYMGLLSWYIADIHQWPQRVQDLYDAGEPAQAIQIRLLLQALTSHDAAQCVATLKRYLVIRHHNAQLAHKHAMIDAGQRRALELEANMLLERWGEPESWEQIFDLLAMDLDDFLPPLPTRTD